MNRYLFAPMLLSVAGLLSGADTAMAQKGGGHGGGGHSSGHSSAGHSSGGHSGGGTSHGGAGHSHGDVHFYGGGYGGGYYGGFGYGLGLYPSYGYSPSYYDSYYPPQEYYAPSTDYYVQPTTPADTASVRVILPDPQARVWFDSRPTTQQGTERLFTTPPLSSGARYQIRASWLQNGREMTREQSVPVAPGQTSVVDFSKASSEAVPAPRSR